MNSPLLVTTSSISGPSFAFVTLVLAIMFVTTLPTVADNSLVDDTSIDDDDPVYLTGVTSEVHYCCCSVDSESSTLAI